MAIQIKPPTGSAEDATSQQLADIRDGLDVPSEAEVAAADAATIAAHNGASDPHTQYHNNTRGDARYVRSVNGVGPDGSGNVTVSGSGTTIVDTLVSTSTTAALSANQGKVLKDLVDSTTGTLTSAITAKVANDTSASTTVAPSKTAITAYADAKVQTGAIAASATVAPNATAVQNAIAAAVGAGVPDSPTFTGRVTQAGATITTANPLTVTTNAAVIDVTKALNTVSHNANLTLTNSGTPATANQWYGVHIINTDTAPHVISFPSAFSQVKQALTTTCPIAASGQLTLAFRYDGSAYKVYGDGPFLNKFDATTDPGVGDDIADGFGPGSLFGNAASGALFWCESNAAGAAVWNPAGTGGGAGVTDGDKGDITVSGTGATWTIDAGAVTLAKMANMATASVIGRTTASTGVPEVLSMATLKTALAISSGDVSGLSEAVDDRVAALVVAGSGISATYNDGAGTLTLAATGGAGTDLPYGTKVWIRNDFPSTQSILPLTLTALAAGSTADASPTGNFVDRFGVIRVNNSTSANSGAVLWNSGRRLGIGDMYECSLSPNDIANFSGYFGWTDSLSVTVPSNGIWMGVVAGVVNARHKSGDDTVDVTGATSAITLVNGTWYRFLIEILTQTSVKFSIFNDANTEVWTYTSSGEIPDGNSRECYPMLSGWSTATGAAGVVVNYDFMNHGTKRTLPGRG